MRLTRKQLKLILKLAKYWIDNHDTWGLIGRTKTHERIEDLVNDIEHHLEEKE